MFYDIWKYHSTSAARLITSQEELDSLNEEWKSSPQEAAIYARTQGATDNDGGGAPVRQPDPNPVVLPDPPVVVPDTRAADEAALKAKIAAEDAELASMIAEDEKAKQAALVSQAIEIGIANAADRDRENQADPRKADQ